MRSMKKIITFLLTLLFINNVYAAPYLIVQGGTGNSTSTKGDLLVGTSTGSSYTRLPIGTTGNVLWVLNGQPAWVATSSLGLGGGGSGTVTSVSAVNNANGLTVSSTTCTTACILTFALTGGYVIPLTASTTEWSTAYASTTALTPAYLRGLFSGTYPIIYNSSTGNFSSGFSTSTVNVFTNLNTFQATTTMATTTIASSTITNLNVPGFLSVLSGSTTGAFTVGGQFFFGNASGSSLLLSGPATINGQTNFSTASGTGITVPNVFLTGLSSTFLAADQFGRIIATTTPSGTVSGTAGRSAYFNTASTLGSGSLYDNGTVSGVNGTSSLYNFYILNTAGLSPFAVASSTNTMFVVDKTGNVGVATSTFLTGNQSEKFKVDCGTITENCLNGYANTNDFSQFVMTNISSGVNASAGFTAQNASSTATTTFAWMGINGVGFATSTTYDVGFANDTSFIGSGGDVLIGAISANKFIRFLTGGTSTTTQTAMTIDGSGNVRILKGLADTTNSTGTLGMLLQSTGTSTKWVATSTLGITGGGGVSGSGNIGQSAYWTGASSLGSSGDIFDNGTVSGVNATSSTVNFNIKGTGLNNPFVVSSSSGSVIFNVSSSSVVSVGTSTVTGGTFNVINSGSNYVAQFIKTDTSAQGIASTRQQSSSGAYIPFYGGFANTLSYSTPISSNVIEIENTAGGANNYAGIYLRSGSLDTNIAAVFSGTADQGRLAYGVEGTEVMSMLHSGFTGFGTTSPIATLQVTGPAINQNAANTSISRGLYIFPNPTNAANTLLATDYRGFEVAPYTFQLSSTTAITRTYGSLFNAPIIATTTSATLGSAINVFINGAPKSTSNLIISSSSALTIGTAAVSSTTNAFGLYVEAPTGATNNFAAALFGAVGIGTTTGQYGFTVATTSQFTAGIAPRVIGYSAASTITVDATKTDTATTTVNQTTTFANPTGIPYDQYKLTYVIEATTTQTISWGNQFASSTGMAFPTSVASGTTYVNWNYNKWTNKLQLTGAVYTFQ